MEKIKRINERIGSWLASSLSSMLCFYFILALASIPLIMSPPLKPMEWFYVISTMFQGLALPILAFVSKIESKKQQTLLEDTYKMLVEDIKTLKEVQQEISEINDALDEDCYCREDVPFDF